MRPILLVRGAAVVAALFAASLISFPSFPSVSLFTVNPPAVDRTLKGDRLPLAASVDKIGAPAFARAANTWKGAGRLRRGIQRDFLAASGERFPTLHGLTKIRTI
jgi:hypothetical protein